MSIHHSHLFRGEVSEERQEAIQSVLNDFEADLCCVHLPGDPGPRGWINSPNMGHPQDTIRDREITEALTDAGLYPIVEC